VQSCFALQWWRWAHGAEETAGDQCAVEKLANKFVGKGQSIEELIVAIVLDAGFASRLDDGTAASTPPPATTTDAGVSETAPPPPPPTGDVDVSVKTDSMWASGYCDSVTVTNKSAAPVDWTAKLPADGTISTKWNATVTTEGTTFVFRGDASNASLAAGASTTFGFCVAK
jgi:cellulase/cellobiase CelA1